MWWAGPGLLVGGCAGGGGCGRSIKKYESEFAEEVGVTGDYDLYVLVNRALLENERGMDEYKCRSLHGNRGR